MAQELLHNLQRHPRAQELRCPVVAEVVGRQAFVQVQGVDGLLLGDQTGLGSVVMWQKNGIVYVVGGQVKDNEALEVANSLPLK